MKIQGELNDVTNIMKKNLNDLLKREENLEGLISKSEHLSSSSKLFYKKAKESNKKCCSMS